MSNPAQDETRSATDSESAAPLPYIDDLCNRAWELRHQDAASALADEAHLLATTYAYPKGVAHSTLARAFAQFRLARLQAARVSAEQSRVLLGLKGTNRDWHAPSTYLVSFTASPASCSGHFGLF